jgi:uncharacterized membrane protein
LIRVTLYYLDGVGDVSEVREALASLQAEIPHQLLEIDISEDSALEKAYGSRVPVVEVGSYTLNAPFSEIDLRVSLGAARDSSDRSEDASATSGDKSATSGYKSATSGDKAATSGDKSATSGDKSATSGNKSATSGDKSATSGDKSATSGEKAATSGDTSTTSGDKSAASGEKSATGSQAWGMRMNRGVRYFSRHWLAAFSLVVLLYAGLPFMAPTLMKVGATGPARVIYTLYSPFCHQFAFRSFFLFGPQAAYPRELAGTDLVSYGEATGLDEGDVIAARRYVGDETVGYKAALCERDIGIYVGILVAGLVYGFIRNRRGVKPLPLKFWFLLGIVPIALDGGTQLISQLGIFPFPARESTPLLRTATGLLFGAMNIWMAYPHVDQAMKDTNQTTSAKIAIAEQRAEQISDPGA